MEAASGSLEPRYAPDDPTLPSPWKGLIDGNTGILYYWNPETNVTQYERPSAPTVPAASQPLATQPNLAPIPGAQAVPNNNSMQLPSQTVLTQFGHSGQQQQQQSQQVPFQMVGQQFPQQEITQTAYQRQQQQPLPQQQQQPLPQQQSQQYPNFQPQQMMYQQPPYQQYPNFQQQAPPPAYNQGQQQPQGVLVPQGQAPQVLQPSHSQGLQMAHPFPDQGLRSGPHQENLQQAMQFSYQQGQPSHIQPPQGQKLGGFTNVNEMLSHDENQAGRPMTFDQHGGQVPPNQRIPPSHPTQGAVGAPFPLTQQIGASPRVDGDDRFTSSSVQGQHDMNYRPPQQPYGTGIPSNAGPSPVRHPPGFGIGDNEDRFHGMGKEMYSSGGLEGPNAPPQQPKNPAFHHPQIHSDIRGAPSFPQSGHLGGHNVLPPHPVPSMYGHNAISNAAALAPSSRMFAPPDFPSLSAADAYRQHHEVTAMGDDVPPPFMTFEATGFPTEILREIQMAGFLTPTPIQAQTWPVALQNRDIVAIAKTGSGKTLGYLIPAFIHLRKCHNNPMLGPTVLILAPTRELASQIQEEAIKFGSSSRVSCTCLYGGAPKGPQLREIERGAEIVVATPGRLNDFLEMRKINFRQISFLVLDEADRMLDMGFEPQIRKIVNEIPSHRQTLMYTATWPKEVRKIAGDLLRNPVQVNIGSIDELVANKSITQYVEVVAPMDKQRRLEQILRAQERGSRIIIFCSTKKLCDQLARGIGRSFGAAAIHGDKSQAERDHVLNEFRNGRAPILVATDVAARGLDIKDIRVVINYDFPTGIEDYVHRIGRTGRAGASGVSYTFFSEQDWKYAADLVKVLEGASQHVPPELHDMAARARPPAHRSGMSRWDSGVGGHFEAGGGWPGIPDSPGNFNGREGPMGFGGREGPGAFGERDGPGGFGGRNGPGGFGGRGDGPGGFGGRGDGPGGFGGRGDGLGRFGGRGDGPGRFGGRGDGPGRFGGRGDSFGGRGDGFGGRGGLGGFAGRDGPGGYGGRGGRGHGGFGGRVGAGPGGFSRGGRGDGLGGFSGRNGRGEFFGGRGPRGGPRFHGPGSPMGRGRLDRGGTRDRYLHSDVRGRHDGRKIFGDRGRNRSYSQSPDRSRSRGRSRSRSRSRSWSRSPSRSWSSRSLSRSRSRSLDRRHPASGDQEPQVRRKSGFDVLPPANVEPPLPQPGGDRPPSSAAQGGRFFPANGGGLEAEPDQGPTDRQIECNHSDAAAAIPVTEEAADVAAVAEE